MTGVIDHVAFNAEEPTWYVEYFGAVFGMQPVREKRAEDGTLLQVWLDGGVQIDCGAEASNGLLTHFSLRTTDVAAAVSASLARGAVPVQGKGSHWVRLPNGAALELKPWTKE